MGKTDYLVPVTRAEDYQSAILRALARIEALLAELVELSAEPEVVTGPPVRKNKKGK